MNNGYINRTICVAAANPSERNSFKSHLVSPFFRLRFLLFPLLSRLFSPLPLASSAFLFVFEPPSLRRLRRRLSSPPFSLGGREEEIKKKKKIRLRVARFENRAHAMTERARLWYFCQRRLLASMVVSRTRCKRRRDAKRTAFRFPDVRNELRVYSRIAQVDWNRLFFRLVRIAVSLAEIYRRGHVRVIERSSDSVSPFETSFASANDEKIVAWHGGQNGEQRLTSTILIASLT